jgi:hypothetical protein
MELSTIYTCGVKTVYNIVHAQNTCPARFFSFEAENKTIGLPQKQP